MNKTLLIVFACLTLPVSAEKYVDLHRVNIVEEYTLQKMLPGKIVPKRQSTLGFEAAGKVKGIHVDIGDNVAKGDLLAELEDLEARALFNEAAANLSMRKKMFARARSLDNENVVSQQQLENTESQFLIAKAQHARASIKLQQTKIRAPYDGIIQSRFLDEGSIVNAGAALVEIIDDEYVEARIAIPRSLLEVMQIGEKYQFTINAKGFEADLARLAPMPARGSNHRLAIFEFSTFFNPGATARLTLAVTESKRGAWVPLNSISQAEQGLWTVYTLSSDNRAQKDFVELIHIEDDRAFVSGTLKNGDRVIVGGASKVADGQAVRDSQ